MAKARTLVAALPNPVMDVDAFIAERTRWQLPASDDLFDATAILASLNGEVGAEIGDALLDAALAPRQPGPILPMRQGSKSS